MKPAGKVFLVGAGPGDTGLLTIKAQRLLEQAEVIIYDRLVNRRILDHVRPKAEVIYVGKESSNHALPQDQINRLLVSKAREGKMVVRLKGGDPFVFGRGGEEADYLQENHVAFEIVPGVTPSIAAPAYAGIPVTHRDYTSTLTIITGHEKPGKDEKAIPWPELGRGTGTLVFLMGIENLAYIAENLMNHGRSPDTPVALIRWGTYPYQEVLTGRLNTIAELAESHNFAPPAVIVVGKVVELRNRLRWFDSAPLFGQRIVVTRARAQSSRMVARLQELGAEVIEYPTIEIAGIPQPRLREIVPRIESYAWLIFTSVNGVKEFFQQVFELGFEIRDLKGPKICAIGPATAAELKRMGLHVTLVPDEFVAEALAESLTAKVKPGDKVLLARARGARDVLPKALKDAGAEVEVIDMYEAVPAASSSEHLEMCIEQGGPDLITFTSSSTVRNFVQMAGPEAIQKIKDRAIIACIGPVTSETALNEGLQVDIIAENYTIDGLIDAIVRYMDGGN